jgi:hypothetical protein
LGEEQSGLDNVRAQPSQRHDTIIIKHFITEILEVALKNEERALLHLQLQKKNNLQTANMLAT